MPGKFLSQEQVQGQAQMPTARRPFTQHEGVDRAIQSAREGCGHQEGKKQASGRGFYIDLESLHDDIQELPMSA